MKIGDVIYYIMDNGYSFQTKEIVGETSRSWVTLAVGAPSWKKESPRLERYATKLPKSGKGYRLGTKAEADLQSWALANRYEISRKVERLQDRKVLLAIARMVGYEKLLEEEPNETA
jgi:hypothetical protein